MSPISRSRVLLPDIIQMLLEADQAGKQTIGIFGLSPHFQKVFTMVGINRYAAMHHEEASALAAM